MLGILLVSDALFSYFLESIKIFCGIQFAAELSLNMTEPYFMDYDFLIVTGILTMFIVYQTDNHTGKYTMVRVGLFFLFASSICSAIALSVNFGRNLESDTLKFLCRITSLLYVMTSPCRNMLILQQIRVPSDFDKLRPFLFLLIYFRILGRGITMVINKSDKAEDVFRSQSILSPFAVFGYYTLLTCCIGEALYFEKVANGIWKSVLGCFGLAVYEKLSNWNAPIPKPCPAKLAPYGTISQGRYVNAYRLSSAPSAPSAPSATSAQLASDPQSIAISKLDFLPIEHTQNKTNELLRPARYFKRFAFPWSVERYSQNIIQELMIKEELNHWICRARKRFPEFEIRETVYFYNILSFIVFGVAFSLLNYVFACFTINQGLMAQRKFAIEKIDITTLIIVTDICLYPLVEYWLHPSLKKKIQRDVYFFLLGYIFLLLAFVITIFVQIKLKSLPYYPRPNRTQVRIFNGINETIVISDSAKKQLRCIVPSYDYALISNIVFKEGREKKTFYIDGMFGLLPFNFEIEDTRTLHFLVDFNGIIKISSACDYSAFNYEGDTFSSKYFVVTSNPKLLDSFSFITEDSTLIQHVNNTNAYAIEPDNYQIRVKTKSETLEAMKTGFKVMDEGAVYSFLIFSNMSQMFAKFVYLEGPLPLAYITLFPQIILASLGNAFATVSFFRHLYLESPQKLRCTVLGLLLALNSELMACLLWNKFSDVVYDGYLRFMYIFIIIHCILIAWCVYAATTFHHRFRKYSSYC